MGLTQFNNEYLMFGDEYIGEPWYDPYNPLNLPPYTIRLKYMDGVTPYFGKKGTLNQVSVSPNIWDLTYENTNWQGLVRGDYGSQETGLIEVIGANSTNVTSMQTFLGYCRNLTAVPLFDTSDVTNMGGMFNRCYSLSSVPLYDTHNVTNMGQMFENCGELTTVPLFDTYNVTSMYSMFRQIDTQGHGDHLTSVPLFNTYNVTDMGGMFEGCDLLTSVPLYDTHNVKSMVSMFYGCDGLKYVPLFNTDKVESVTWFCRFCFNVESGALAFYNQVSTQATPPTSHLEAFEECGRNTVQGAAELAQIPDDWK